MNFTRQTTKQFVLKANVIHNFKYEYPDEYVHSRAFINIICPTHGNFSMRAYSHLDGCGCKKCDIERRAFNNRYTHETFLNKATKVHNKKYSYPALYEHSNKLLTIVCPIHGEFQQLPYLHLLGNGFKKCADANRTGGYTQEWFNFNPTRNTLPGIIYVLESDKENGFYKLGITSNLKERLSHYPKQLNCKVLWSANTLLYIAFLSEQEVLEKYTIYQFWPNSEFIGHTECFQKTFKIVEAVETTLTKFTKQQDVNNTQERNLCHYH